MHQFIERLDLLQVRTDDTRMGSGVLDVNLASVVIRIIGAAPLWLEYVAYRSTCMWLPWELGLIDNLHPSKASLLSHPLY